VRHSRFLVAIALIALPGESAAQSSTDGRVADYSPFDQPIGLQETGSAKAATHSLRVAAGGGFMWSRPIARAALAYEYRPGAGAILVAEAGMGLWFEDDGGTFGLFTPGIKLALSPKAPQSLFISAGVSVFVESSTEVGFNLGAGYDTALVGRGVRVEGRVHVVGDDPDGGSLWIAELMLSLPIL